MSIYPPARRLWWKEPIAQSEIIWIVVAFCWGLVMFFMMIYWHVTGQQNLSSEAYKISPALFSERTQNMVDQYTVRTDASGYEVVRPPPGSDIYMLGRLWEWWPILELQSGESYRLHLSSLDWQHGFSLQPVNINIQVHPGYEMVLEIEPTDTGEYTVVCNEFCGLGHHLMTGKIFVVD